MINIDDCVLIAPLSAIVSVLMVLGFVQTGVICCVRIFGPDADSVEKAASFIGITGIAAAIIHFMAFGGFAYFWALRTLAWIMAALGLYGILRAVYQAQLHELLQNTMRFYRRNSVWGKIGFAFCIVIGVALLLASLGPPTDADSLDYHLGVPIDILRQHRILARPDWLHARLIGLGEYLNLLGLAGGTDTFGACLQIAGLLALVYVIPAFISKDENRILAGMLLLGCPLTLFLIPTQKPQMLPAAATTIALIMIIRRIQDMDIQTIAVSIAITFYAMASKYSFILSGCVIVCFAIIVSHKHGLLKGACWGIIFSLMLFIFPISLQRFLFYGDPITPLLERFKPDGQRYIIAFAQYLKDYKDSSVPFPFSLIISDSLPAVVTTLGLGVFGVISIFRVSGPYRFMIECSMIAAILIFLLGQTTSRFYLEPYLWIVFSVSAADAWRCKSLFQKVLLVQMAGVSAIAVFLVMILFPGALNPILRHHVMVQYALDYAATQWVNGRLPSNAIVVTDLRSKALMPREFVCGDIVGKDEFKNTGHPFHLSEYFKEKGATHWISSGPLDQRAIPGLMLTQIAKSEPFRYGVKNPWSRERSHCYIYRIDYLPNVMTPEN